MWLPIPAFPHYEVSDSGEVRTWRKKTRVWRHADTSGVRDSPVLMSPVSDRRGYLRVALRNEQGVAKQCLVHRLVATAFLVNPHRLPDVAHNDGDTSNNHVCNLRWSSHRDNQMDMRKHGTMQDGAKCITAKVTPELVLEIRQRCATEGRGVGRRLAAELGLSVAQISRIKNGQRWQYLL